MARRGTTAIAMTLVLALGASGCRAANIECVDMPAEACQQAADAAALRLPAGFVQLTIGGGVGVRQPPYPVVACYPDGSEVTLEVAFEGRNAIARPAPERLPGDPCT